MKRLIVIFSFLIILMCSSCIYASDVNGTASDISQNCTSADNSISNCHASFDELGSDIQKLASGDVFNVDKDYCFDNKCSSFENNPCINIAGDNITINGNGHIIDGKNKSVSFNIKGNNVKINNLTVINCEGYKETFKISIGGSSASSEFVSDLSPFYWTGDNGMLSDCIFSGNCAVNGGAVTWRGNDGVINDVLFINNCAEGAGGALYLGGRNNKINNTLFVNSTSGLLNEAVYLDKKHDSCMFNNITYNGIFCVNGTALNLDVENLQKVYYSRIMGENINIIPMIYSSLGGVCFLDNDTYYYGQFSKENHTFVLSVVKNIDLGIIYEMEYVIQAEDLNDIFAGLMSNLYKVNLKFIKNVNIHNSNLTEYNAVLSNDRGYYFNIQIMDMINCNTSQISNLDKVDYILNVNFDNNSYFASNMHWKEDNGFNIINVNGNGAIIHATSGDRDENKWIINNKCTFIISNLTLEGFNTAVENHNALCIFNNVVFKDNKMDYRCDKDYGAAIFNSGTVMCVHCSFINNYAKYGGAIYNKGTLVLQNCSFANNKGYGSGNDVLNVDSGVVMLNGSIVSGSEGPIEYSLNPNSKYWLNTIGAIAGVLSCAAGFGGIVIAYFAAHCVLTTSLAIGLGAGVVLSAGIATGASFLSSSISGVDVTSILKVYLPVCIGAGINGAITGFALCSSYPNTNNRIDIVEESSEVQSNLEVQSNPEVQSNSEVRSNFEFKDDMIISDNNRKGLDNILDENDQIITGSYENKLVVNERCDNNGMGLDNNNGNGFDIDKDSFIKESSNNRIKKASLKWRNRQLNVIKESKYEDDMMGDIAPNFKIPEYYDANAKLYDNSIIKTEHPHITKLRKMLNLPLMRLDESIKHSTAQTEAAYRGYILGPNHYLFFNEGGEISRVDITNIWYFGDAVYASSAIDAPTLITPEMAYQMNPGLFSGYKFVKYPGMFPYKIPI